MNTLIIAGKVVEEPQKSVSSNGVNIARFKMAVDKNGKDGSVNGYDLFEVVVFRELADVNLEVGQFVGVTGKISANNYEKEGKSYYNCSVIGNVISLLGK